METSSVNPCVLKRLELHLYYRRLCRSTIHKQARYCGAVAMETSQSECINVNLLLSEPLYQRINQHLPTDQGAELKLG